VGIAPSFGQEGLAADERRSTPMKIRKSEEILAEAYAERSGHGRRNRHPVETVWGSEIREKSDCAFIRLLCRTPEELRARGGWRATPNGETHQLRAYFSRARFGTKQKMAGSAAADPAIETRRRGRRYCATFTVNDRVGDCTPLTMVLMG
jgi:hypothetical protein